MQTERIFLLSFLNSMPFMSLECLIALTRSLESDTTERLHFHFSLSCIGEENDNPLQCSCLENHRYGGAWWAAVYGVTQNRTRLKQLSSSMLRTSHVHALEKEMATHSSVVAWRIPGTEEPGWLLSMWSHRIGHDWSNLAEAAAYLFTTVIPALSTVRIA